MKTEKIKYIHKRFSKHPEWLLIKVDKIDKSTNTPITGRLLAHSPNRDEIYRKSIEGKGLLMVEYTEHRLPKGYAAAF